MPTVGYILLLTALLLWFKLIVLNQALRIFKASTGIDELPWITAQSHTFAPA